MGVASRSLSSDKAILSQSRGVGRRTGEKDPQGPRSKGLEHLSGCGHGAPWGRVQSSGGSGRLHGGGGGELSPEDVCLYLGRKGGGLSK